MAPMIRPATEADLSAIVDIYNEAGVGTTASYDLEPVTLDERQLWFQRLQARDCPVLVLEIDGEVVGYAAYGPFRDKAGYAHTVEHSVYIADGHRAEGGGRLLMSALIDYARGRGVHVMVGVLDASNDASVAFHERLGFARSAVLPEVGHKFGRWLDVVFMTLTFPDEPGA